MQVDASRAGQERAAIDLLGFKAVTASECDLKRPTEPGVSQHRQKEGADELAVGEPDSLVGIDALDGENVNEDGLCAWKRTLSGVASLRIQPSLDEVAAEAQR